MLNFHKIRPNDGTEEDEAEKIAEAQKQEKISEEKALADFVLKAEEEYNEIEQQKKEELEKLKNGRKDSKEEEDAKKAEKNETIICGQKTEVKKDFTLHKGFGMFNSKGKRDDFGSSKSDRKIERLLKTGARGIKVKKQREFMQLLEKYHGTKGKDLSIIDKDEIVKFEAGLKRGSSDARFKEFSQELKKEGVIKNSADVKRIFSRREMKKIGNALLGRKDQTAYVRAERTDLINKRAGSSDSKSMRRF
ncbi:MAG: hypothetical protein WC178_01050 [Candidatus Paceibacterota bacterium]